MSIVRFYWGSSELDRIFKRIYEDDISGAISHERFLKLSADYEAEQKELTEQVKVWREAVEIFEQDQADFASFAAIVRKYVGIRELTPTIVNEFVKKIIVHAPDKPCRLRRGAGYGACADDGVWGGSPTSIFAGPSALRKWQVCPHLPCLPLRAP